MQRLLAVVASLVLLAFGSAMVRADTFADVIKNGVIRIAVPLDVPPFGSQTADRKAEGFDVELAEMVGKALGVKVELQQVTASNQIGRAHV